MQFSLTSCRMLPLVFAMAVGSLHLAFSQTVSLNGQASSWLTSHPDDALLSHAGLRYVPELSIPDMAIADGWTANLEASVNAWLALSIANNRSTQTDKNIKPYRMWLRLASDQFEARVGLQKINFGSAMLFRPLMWFDRLDPRDPLQLTDGVYAALVRYYFADNTNIWVWGLYGNDGTKGWETIPTKKRSMELGGRIQLPSLSGEMAASYHHRSASLRDTLVAEDRFALDGKWDVGIGLWFEATLTHRTSDLSLTAYQRQWTLGADYTFDIGNGLNVLTEYFRSEQADRPLAKADGAGLSALSASYPFGILDRGSVILYRDWTNDNWYRIATWQRTYDNWIIYLLAFWNPEQVELYQTQSGGSPFSGTGVQIMVVFNH